MRHVADAVLVTMLLGLMACGLFGGASGPAPTPSLMTLACIARYQGCASSLTDASSMADYLACRGAVDRDCANDGGP